MIRKLVFVSVALAAGQAYSLPRIERPPDVSRYTISAPRMPSGRLDGWEMHLTTDTELAVCVNPVVLPDLKVIKCDGIKTLTLLQDLP